MNEIYPTWIRHAVTMASGAERLASRDGGHEVRDSLLSCSRTWSDASSPPSSRWPTATTSAASILRALRHLATLRDQDKLFGSVASDATAWRVLDRVDDDHLARLRAVRAAAGERAWAAGAGPDLGGGLVIDIDATITIAHSEKENAAKAWKKTFGFHPPIRGQSCSRRHQRIRMIRAVIPTHPPYAETQRDSPVACSYPDRPRTVFVI